MDSHQQQLCGTWTSLRFLLIGTYLIYLSVCLELTHEHGAAQGAAECVQLHGQLGALAARQGWLAPSSLRSSSHGLFEGLWFNPCALAGMVSIVLTQPVNNSALACAGREMGFAARFTPMQLPCGEVVPPPRSGPVPARALHSRCQTRGHPLLASSPQGKFS